MSKRSLWGLGSALAAIVTTYLTDLPTAVALGFLAASAACLWFALRWLVRNCALPEWIVSGGALALANFVVWRVRTGDVPYPFAVHVAASILALALALLVAFANRIFDSTGMTPHAFVARPVVWFAAGASIAAVYFNLAFDQTTDIEPSRPRPSVAVPTNDAEAKVYQDGWCPQGELYAFEKSASLPTKLAGQCRAIGTAFCGKLKEVSNTKVAASSDSGQKKEASASLDKLMDQVGLTPRSDRSRRWIGFVTFAISSWLAGYFLARHAQFAGYFDKLQDLQWPYCVIVLIAVWGNIANTLPIDYWEGAALSNLQWISVCATPKLWLIDRLVRLFLMCILALPFSMLWRLGDAAICPKEAEFDSKEHENAWGQGRFGTLLAVWSVVPAIMIVLPAFAWVGIFRSQSAGFVRPWFLVMASVAVAILRLAIQGYRVRLAYRSRRRSMGDASNLPPDPSVLLLGENGWTFPLGALSVLATLWAIIAWSGGGSALTGN